MDNTSTYNSGLVKRLDDFAFWADPLDNDLPRRSSMPCGELGREVIPSARGVASGSNAILFKGLVFSRLVKSFVLLDTGLSTDLDLPRLFSTITFDFTRISGLKENCAYN